MAQDSSPVLLWTMILLGLAAALLFMAAVAAVTYIVINHWPQNPSLPGEQPTASLEAPIVTGPPLPTTGGAMSVPTPSPP